MKALEQVWPVERAAPPGLEVAALRPYQKQSLAFCLQLEQAVDKAETVGTVSRGFGVWQTSPKVRGGWITDEVGMGKTMVVLGLVLANPCPAPKPSTKLMQKLQQCPMAYVAETKWMFDPEMGRHRTGPNPNFDDETRKAAKNLKELKSLGAPARIKTTLVVVPITLIGQWVDELKKFAPALKVSVFHNSVKKKDGGCRNTLSGDSIRDMDILIMAPSGFKALQSEHSWVKHSGLVFWRIVFDECHGDPPRAFGTLSTSNFWGVSATPLTATIRELGFVTSVIGLSPFFGADMGVISRRPQLLEKLRKVMIRHTKAQRINGDVALALTDMEVETKWLDMTATEQSAYDVAVTGDKKGRLTTNGTFSSMYVAKGTSLLQLHPAAPISLQFCHAYHRFLPMRSVLKSCTCDTKPLRTLTRRCRSGCRKASGTSYSTMWTRRTLSPRTTGSRCTPRGPPSRRRARSSSQRPSKTPFTLRGSPDKHVPS